MTEGIPQRELAAWDELVRCYKKYVLAHQAFFQSSLNRVAVIRKALHSKDRAVAVGMARYLTPEEHMALFDEWAYWASSQGCIPAVRNYILSLPREWVMERIEQAVEPYLVDGTEEDFRRYLELYYALDRGLTDKLARRALEHSDEAIQEAGRDFLYKLEKE